MTIVSAGHRRAQAHNRISDRKRGVPEIPRLHWPESIDANRQGLVRRADIPYAMVLHLEALACDFEKLTDLRPTDAKIGFTLSVEF
jgi:hypothetical protein